MNSRPATNSHFQDDLSRRDPILADILAREQARQSSQLELIASENIVSRAVQDAIGAVITNKTVEGYPGARYHGGAEIVDEAEQAAIDRATELFGCRFANVQPHSGTQANQAVFLALLKPGETVMSMSLTAGGHLSHGAPPNLSGKWFDVVQYGVEGASGLLDYDELERKALDHRPKLIITGGSAYPRAIDFSFIRRVAERIGATLLVDMSHFAGLVAGRVHPSPIPHAHVVSTTTTKTLRGPRGALLLTDDGDLARKLDAAVFPGVQGSVHLNHVAAKAVCLGEALRPSFGKYAAQVVANAQALAASLEEEGLDICTGGTDTHLVLVDLKPVELTGFQAEKCLERAGITSNRNPVPFDPPAPGKWTGLRLGTAAATTRGFTAADFKRIGHLMGRLLASARGSGTAAPAVAREVREEVAMMCRRKWPAGQVARNQPLR